jgi:hypothetical protein
MMPPDAGILFSDPSVWDSRRLWSLWDMMNFTLGAFWDGLKHLQHELDITRENVKTGNGLVLIGEDDRSRLQRNMQFAIKWCVEELQIDTAGRVCSEIRFVLRKEICRWIDIHTLLEELWKTLEWETKLEHFFHYKRDDVRRLEHIGTDWENTVKKFKSVNEEIAAALDCYALSDITGCIFHLMRIAESGMRSLARERGVSFKKFPLEWAEWENIIGQIEVEAKRATSAMSRGLGKDAATTFYTDAVAQLRAFKATRNRIMHLRGKFDELDALRGINQVRDFMSKISEKISENTRKPISRWP